MNNYLVSISGPTGIGKTQKSLALAKAFNSEIFSADSRQFYKEMAIGTAVPTAEELALIKHHFIQHISIEDDYSVGDFENVVIQKLTTYFKTHQIAFLVGGSMLYQKAVTEGLNKFPEVLPGLKGILNKELETKGLIFLQNRLKELDPDYAKTVDLSNPHRIIRALEVCVSSGRPFSYFLNQPKPNRNFKVLKIGLKAEREIIYQRIEKRIDIMLEKGLLDEAKRLFKYRNLKALNTIGYKELFNYFEGKYSLDFAVSEIKKNSRRFAKRQLTWYRKDNAINWFSHDCDSKEIEDFIRKQIE